MAARAVIWTEAAWRDLEAAADYIAADSPNYAAALVTEMREAARALTESSLRGRIVPELGDEDIRELIVGNYRMVYHIADTVVTILVVIHGARDFSAAFAHRLA